MVTSGELRNHIVFMTSVPSIVWNVVGTYNCLGFTNEMKFDP